jgi:uncharacterized protein DUF1840
MLVTFKSGSHSEFTMFAEIAEDLLKMMGHSGTIPSALSAKDIPEALKSLQKAIETEPGSSVDEISVDVDEDEEADVSISGRAYPLVEMLTAAVEDGSTVMWFKS